MSTYTPIASQTLASATSSVTLADIPQNYLDLVLVVSVKHASSTQVRLQFNSDTGSNYSITKLYGDGTSAGSIRQSNQTNANIGGVQTEFSTTIINLNGYSNTTTFKTAVVDYRFLDSGYGEAGAAVSLWRNTNAITSITILPTSGNWDAGSTFNLYGIASGSPKALGGDTVTTDGTYYYHTFRSSGTFTPKQALTADYLVVAGGGGGSGANDQGYAGGGGGAGGMRCTVTATGGGGSLESALSLTAQAYTVTVGAGGAGGTNLYGTNGSNSVFSTVTSIGGGGGAQGGNADGVGRAGGSGGGSSGTNIGGAGTSNQGYAGGAGSEPGPRHSGGGGGGASQAGADGTTNGGGNGGNGRATSISGSSVTYAGGGGGGVRTFYTAGSGGTGGGGAGRNGDSGNGENGTANLGGGGGAAGSRSTGLSFQIGGTGGSGIVIIRYAV